MNDINKKQSKILNYTPKVTKSISYSKITLDFYDNNLIMFKLNNKNIDWFYSSAKTKDKTINTNDSKRIKIKSNIKDNKCYIDVTYKKDDLNLIQHFILENNKNYFTTYLTLSSNSNISSNYLAPLDFVYPKTDYEDLFLSLDEEMISVPYDNDMWVYYNSSPLRPGNTSYDLTAIYNPKNNNGLFIGALDFDIWKNGIKCSAYDARSFTVISGISDSQTHDHLPHGYISGKQINSSRFICGFYKDIKKAFEEYGKLCINKNGIYKWNKGAIFGWNSYSALTLETKISDLDKAADFINKNLNNFKDDITYINFDSVINIDKKELIKLIQKLHNNNQKVGWYMNPLSHLKMDDDVKLRGSKLKRKDILMKNNDGSLYPPIDNKYPIDITIPEAELDFRLALREFVELGFDYIKIDFLSHGALEGKRHNKNIKTGRQALMYFYEIVKDELDPNKVGREIFISSSIDPLFPCGYSHSRRSSCDAFGHHEDNRYVLNALTYSWWTNNTLYQYNDPDHTVLYKSLVDGRNSITDAEANSRYNASIISGTMMLLSDDYKDINARNRAIKYANNKNVNEIAKLNKAFKPLRLSNDNNIFYLNNKKNYLAVFNYQNNTQTYTINPKKINLPTKGKLYNIRNHKSYTYDKNIVITLKAYDSIILSD